MSKIVDNNSFWEIKHNPISKVGVYPYLGRSISDECEPDKIYYVYRPAETLAQSVDTWDNPPKPFINDHEMLGEGFSKVDDRPVQGVIHNPVYEDGTLYADISVYSESLKKKIEDGKKELSLGYFCKYEKQKGVYKGQAYDYVQRDMVGNHIALVENGRCGSDVRVFDSKCTMDSLDITTEFQTSNGENKTASNGIIETTETKDSEMADKREYIRKIMAIAGKPDSDFEGGEKEKIETIAKLLENSEYAKSEDEEEKEEEKKSEDESEEKEEEKKTEDKCGKDEDPEEEKKETEDEEVSPADVMAFLKLILEEVRMLNGKKTTDEEESKENSEEEKKSEDEDEEKKSEDEDDEEKEEKKTEDSAIVVQFAKDGAEKPVSMMDDPALRKYLGL
jgi:hypothetical protein